MFHSNLNTVQVVPEHMLNHAGQLNHTIRAYSPVLQLFWTHSHALFLTLQLSLLLSPMFLLPNTLSQAHSSPLSIPFHQSAALSLPRLLQWRTRK